MNAGQIVPLPYLYANGCRVEIVSDTELTISSGQVRDSENAFDISIDEPISIDTTITGAGGLDADSLMSDTFYAVYIIADGSGVLAPSAIISLSPTTPYMPSLENGVTFNLRRLIGYVYIGNAPDNFLESFRIVGNDNCRTHIWDDTPTKLIFDGAPTPPGVFSLYDVGAYIPNIINSSAVPQSLKALFNFFITPSVDGGTIEIKSGDSSGTTSYSVIGTGTTLGLADVSQMWCPVDYVSSIEAYGIRILPTNITNLQINVVGFSYSI